VGEPVIDDVLDVVPAAFYTNFFSSSALASRL
jgi:hypothetical protein